MLRRSAVPSYRVRDACVGVVVERVVAECDVELVGARMLHAAVVAVATPGR